MTFSLVVPVYNIQDWVEKCIESILNQDFEDFELILVDDGSKDSSGKICDTYAQKDQRVRVLHKTNGGLSDARNYGATHAQGQYLLFIDGDDYIASNALSLLNDEICRYDPDIVLTDGKFEVCEEEIRRITIFDRTQFAGISGIEAVRKTSKITPNWSGWGKCFRMTFWKENGFEFKKNRLSEDMQLIDRVVMCASKVSMAPTYYYYQYRSDSIVHTVKAKMVYDLLENLSEWKDYLDNSEYDEQLKEQIYAMHAPILCHSVMAYIYVVEENERKGLLEQTGKNLSCLKYGKTLECKMILVATKVIGLKNTCKLLGKVKGKRIARER